MFHFSEKNKLHQFAYLGRDTELKEELSKASKDSIDHLDENHQITLLTAACVGGHANIVKFLLDQYNGVDAYQWILKQTSQIPEENLELAVSLVLHSRMKDAASNNYRAALTTLKTESTDKTKKNIEQALAIYQTAKARFELLNNNPALHQEFAELEDSPLEYLIKFYKIFSSYQFNVLIFTDNFLSKECQFLAAQRSLILGKFKNYLDKNPGKSEGANGLLLSLLKCINLFFSLGMEINLKEDIKDISDLVRRNQDISLKHQQLVNFLDCILAANKQQRLGNETFIQVDETLSTVLRFYLKELLTGKFVIITDSLPSMEAILHAVDLSQCSSEKKSTVINNYLTTYTLIWRYLIFQEGLEQSSNPSVIQGFFLRTLRHVKKILSNNPNENVFYKLLMLLNVVVVGLEKNEVDDRYLSLFGDLIVLMKSKEIKEKEVRETLKKRQEDCEEIKLLFSIIPDPVDYFNRMVEKLWSAITPISLANEKNKKFDKAIHFLLFSTYNDKASASCLFMPKIEELTLKFLGGPSFKIKTLNTLIKNLIKRFINIPNKQPLLNLFRSVLGNLPKVEFSQHKIDVVSNMFVVTFSAKAELIRNDLGLQLMELFIEESDTQFNDELIERALELFPTNFSVKTDIVCASVLSKMAVCAQNEENLPDALNYSRRAMARGKIGNKQADFITNFCVLALKRAKILLDKKNFNGAALLCSNMLEEIIAESSSLKFVAEIYFTQYQAIYFDIERQFNNKKYLKVSERVPRLLEEMEEAVAKYIAQSEFMAEWRLLKEKYSEFLRQSQSSLSSLASSSYSPALYLDIKNHKPKVTTTKEKPREDTDLDGDNNNISIKASMPIFKKKKLTGGGLICNPLHSASLPIEKSTIWPMFPKNNPDLMWLRDKKPLVYKEFKRIVLAGKIGSSFGHSCIKQIGKFFEGKGSERDRLYPHKETIDGYDCLVFGHYNAKPNGK